jgi:competence protein ComEA
MAQSIDRRSMSPAERRALLLVLGLAVGGHAVRLVAGGAGEPPGGIQVVGRSDSQDASPGAHRDSARLADRPLAPGERIDVDRAGWRELARLPRVGPALARRIVADREARGAFGGPAGLDRVPGVGAGLLESLAPHVRFSGTPAAAPTATSGTQGATPGAPGLNLNASTADDLDALPGIGPARARAIVAWRERHGPFRSAGELAAVPGIGPDLAARLWLLAGAGAAR